MNTETGANEPHRRCKLEHEHRHGENGTCYSKGGCRCEPCRDFESRRSKRYVGSRKRARAQRGEDIWIPSIGSTRRLQAMAVMGWSLREISDATGLHSRSIRRLQHGLNGEVCARTTALPIRRAYEILGFSEAPRRRGSTNVRNRALAKGWRSAMHWDDIDHDPKPITIYRKGQEESK